jgi:hypothetical protein
MPEANQYLFSHKEVTEMLVRAAGIHEGRWMLTVNFGFSAANFGPTPEQAGPGAVVGILGIGIQRVTQEGPPLATIVDAAAINPAKSST